MQVYPNPANDLIQLIVPEALLKDAPVAELFSITGQQIMKMNLQSTQQSFNSSTLANGVYILRVNGKTRMASQLLVIQH